MRSLCLLLCVAACGTEPDTHSGNRGSPHHGTRAGDRDGGDFDGGVETGGDHDSELPSNDVSWCQMACTSSADCSQNTAAYDADNYSCVSGICRYDGCRNDAECTASWNQSGYVCGSAVFGVRYCAEVCSQPSDCTLGLAAYDADNYNCVSGACVYLGCRSDAECAASFTTGSYGCSAFAQYGTRACTKLCGSASDCGTDTGAYSTDNFACSGGRCEYTGCTSTSECVTSTSSDRFVCRALASF
jgi:hypothetical protein